MSRNTIKSIINATSDYTDTFFVGWNAVKYTFFIFLTFIVCLTGCKSQETPSNNDSSDNIAIYNSIIAEYLQKQSLPDLESVEPWQNENGPGLKISTPHYEVFTTLMDRFLLSTIPAFIESAYNVYNNQLPEPVISSTKFTIYLFASRTQWEHFTWTFAGDQAEIFYKIKAGAYYHNGSCVVYNIGTNRTLSAIGHEGWHQFSSRHFKYRLPSWLDEGVAMLFETYSYKDGTIYFEPYKNSYRLDALQKTLSSGTMISLNELTAINPGQVLASDQAQAVSAFYSQSYALVRFLREYNHGSRRNIYDKLMTDGFLGKWPLDNVSKEIAMNRNLPRTILWNHIVGTQLFQQYIDDDFEKIEKEYIEFCRQITN
ncbi:MAG: hypothetical protein JXA96_09885 [Sedimentisphaerales bacterium]|nr:hypothetical protein [Sedimentisphaerales bacterium]